MSRSPSPPLAAAWLQARPGEDDAPRRVWVYRHVLAAIRDGLLPPGAELPASRRLALLWGVARGAVDDGLARLQREGFVERRVGQGSRVALRPPSPPQAEARAPIHPPVSRALARVAPIVRTPPRIVPFTHGKPALRPRAYEKESFPMAPWRRQLQRALDDDSRASLCYGPPAGLPALREATARFLGLTRGMKVSAAQVLIVNSPSQALDLVARVLLEPGDCVAVEDPGYISIARCLALAQLDVRGVPVDAEGFDVAAAMRQLPHAAAVCVHPLNHYPTGAYLSAPRRRALLDWARGAGTWVIECDQYGEIVHDGAAPAPLHAADRDERVLFIGSYSGVMFPTLRLTYLVLPERLVDAFAAVRGMLGDHSPFTMQQALAGFVDEGHLGAHLRTLRALLRERRDLLRDTLLRRLPRQAVLGPMRGGLHGHLRLADAVDDVALAALLADRGFGLEPMSSYAWGAPRVRGLVFGYGGESAASAERAAERLADELAGALPG